ncbi:MAG: protein kinase [Polyangiaceae bacterium]
MGTADYELAVGQMVGEYRIERKIGEGGFGKVYAAVHPVIGKAAAVKILNPDLAKSEEMVSRFVSEARAVNQIRHRNIIDIFSFGTLPGPLHYFVMEFLEGMTLDAYLRKNGPLPPDLAFSILWPIGRALQAAHKHGIAHRDLKPENVFLIFDQDGGIFPKLLDFGIAKLLHESEMAHRTRTGAMLGTPIYMSPEQCRGTTIDHRSDIYSFGIMVHEVLTGGRPFSGDTLMDLLMKQVTEPAPPMSSSRPGLPRSLDAAVLHMLEKAPEKRPESMAAALEELGAAARAAGIAVPGGAQVQAPASAEARASSPSVPADPHLDTNAWLQQSTPHPSGARPPSSGAAHAVTGPPNPSGNYGPSPQHQSGNLGQAAQHQSGNLGQAPQHQSGNYGQSPQHQSGNLGQSPQYQSANLGQAPGYGGQMAQAGGNYGPVPFQGPAPGQQGWGNAGYGQGGYPPQAPTLQSAGNGGSQKSSGLVWGILLGVLALFVAGVVGMCSLAEGIGSGGGGGVTIGAVGPSVGAPIARESTDDLTMEFTPVGQQIITGSTQVHSHRRFTLKVLATADSHVSRAEVAYTDASVRTTGPEKKVENEDEPVANRTYLVETAGAALTVTAMSGGAITDTERDQVVNDVAAFFKPKPRMFDKPLHIGDALTPSSEEVVEMLSLGSATWNSKVRADNATFKLAYVDDAAKTATFEVAFLFSYEEGLLALKVPLEGTITYDQATGTALRGALHGAVDGSFTSDGKRFHVTGDFKAESH